MEMCPLKRGAGTAEAAGVGLALLPRSSFPHLPIFRSVD